MFICIAIYRDIGFVCIHCFDKWKRFICNKASFAIKKNENGSSYFWILMVQNEKHNVF